MDRDRPLVVSLSPEREEPAELARAVEVLRSGGLVAYPTETFYGLGCDPHREDAVARLVSVKGRPPDKPLPLVVGRRAHLPSVAARLDAPFAELVDRFWPGPLTLILPAAEGLAAPVTASTGTVAVRWTSSVVARRLLLAFGGALVATSANRSGGEPARTAADVVDSLGADVDLVLDGGTAPGGRPSTLIDLTCRPPLVLREGAVPMGELQRYLRPDESGQSG
jgi:L-threonylcarbamoyladenylate synthase